MPNLGGLDMTRQLRAQGVTTPIIAVVDATLPDIQEAVTAGMSDALFEALSH
jgi:CheY-like chemotaxis protein